MKSFTYYDYIKYIHTLRLNAIFRLAEEGNEYKLDIRRFELNHAIGDRCYGENKEEVSK